MFSSFHSVPRKLAETGLSSLASRKGLAASAGAASKIDMIAIAICRRFFIREIVAGERLTLHLRISQSAPYEESDFLRCRVLAGHSCFGRGFRARDLSRRNCLRTE